MWTYLGRVIKQGRAWTDAEGVQHPAQWNRWTDEEKAAKGLVWNQDLQPVPFDNRFYWSAGVPKALDDVNAVDEDGNPVLDEDGVQIVTKGLKSNAIAQVKATAGSLHNQLIGWLRERQRRERRYQVPLEITERLSELRQRLSRLPQQGSLPQKHLWLSMTLLWTLTVTSQAMHLLTTGRMRSKERR